MKINQVRKFIAMMILFVQCTSQYENGERELNLENFDEAKSYYKLVKRGDSDYERAQSRLLKIDSIIVKQTFDSGTRLFNEKLYSDAEALFLKVDSTSHLYNESKTFLKRVDSVRQARRLEYKRLEKERKIEGEKIAKLKEQEDAKALKQVKQKVRVLFNELIAFKGKSDFKYYGFGVGYKYNKWLTDVQALENTPEANLLLGLGLEYVSSKGAETEYSRWAKKTISDGLNK